MKDYYSNDVETAAKLALGEELPVDRERPTREDLDEDDREYKRWLRRGARHDDA